MSTARNIGVDRARTREVLDGASQDVDDKTNWLGHSLDHLTSRLDGMLVAGTTRAALDETRGAIDQHIAHLRIEHGLDVRERNGSLFLEVPDA